MIRRARFVYPRDTADGRFDAQVWARDPGNQDGLRLSSGIELAVCP